MRSVMPLIIKQCASVLHRTQEMLKLNAVSILPKAFTQQRFDLKNLFFFPLLVQLPPGPRVEATNADLQVSCLSDGVEVHVHIYEWFNGLLYVKGHSKDEQCRRVINISGNTTEVFRVNFGNCGLIHVNVSVENQNHNHFRF